MNRDDHFWTDLGRSMGVIDEDLHYWKKKADELQDLHERIRKGREANRRRLMELPEDHEDYVQVWMWEVEA